LEDQRLARARRHNAERIAAFQDRPDDLLLPWPEGMEAEALTQCVQEQVSVDGSGVGCNSDCSIHGVGKAQASRQTFPPLATYEATAQLPQRPRPCYIHRPVIRSPRNPY